MKKKLWGILFLLRILQTCEQLEKWGTWSISDNDNREKLWEDVDDTPERVLKTDREMFHCEQMGDT